MKDAGDYLAYIKALIIANPQVLKSIVIAEEAQGESGLLRYRLTLQDNGLLEIFERFHILEGRSQVTKYSFHWQNSAGQLVKRWDNATHHPEISTWPAHIHEGAEENVRPHGPISSEEVLALLEVELPKDKK